MVPRSGRRHSRSANIISAERPLFPKADVPKPRNGRIPRSAFGHNPKYAKLLGTTLCSFPTGRMRPLTVPSFVPIPRICLPTMSLECGVGPLHYFLTTWWREPLIEVFCSGYENSLAPLYRRRANGNPSRGTIQPHRDTDPASCRVAGAGRRLRPMEWLVDLVKNFV